VVMTTTGAFVLAVGDLWHALAWYE
jgi:hypothetical protein